MFFMESVLNKAKAAVSTAVWQLFSFTQVFCTVWKCATWMCWLVSSNTAAQIYYSSNLKKNSMSNLIAPDSTWCHPKSFWRSSKIHNTYRVRTVKYDGHINSEGQTARISIYSFCLQPPHKTYVLLYLQKYQDPTTQKQARCMWVRSHHCFSHASRWV